MQFAALLALAIADSVNPSAIVVALYLLTRSGPAPQVLTYVSAIFLTYFTLGLLLLSGFSLLWPTSGDPLRSWWGLLLQMAIGVGLLVYALRGSARGEPAQPTLPSKGTYAAVFALGVAVTAMELPTALPYFGAIAVLTSMELSAGPRAAVLAVYNLIFVLPPLLLLAGHELARGRLDERYAALRARLEHAADETTRWIAGLLGGALFVTSVIEYVARYARG